MLYCGASFFELLLDKFCQLIHKKVKSSLIAIYMLLSHHHHHHHHDHHHSHHHYHHHHHHHYHHHHYHHHRQPPPLPPYTCWGYKQLELCSVGLLVIHISLCSPTCRLDLGNLYKMLAAYKYTDAHAHTHKITNARCLSPLHCSASTPLTCIWRLTNCFI